MKILGIRALHRNASAALLTLALVLGASTATFSKDFRLPSGYVVTLNEDGLSSVSFGGKQVATGNVQILDGTWFYEPWVTRSFTPDVTAKSVDYVSNGAKVTHSYSGVLKALAIYSYTITGDDILVSAWVTNQSSKPATIVAFRSPRFLYADRAAAQASSNQLGFDQSHTQNNGVNLSYPSVNVRFAATYVRTPSASGAPINFCTWSSESPDERFMTMGTGISQLPGVSVTNFFFKAIPAFGSQTFKFSYRFGSSKDAHVLLQSYKDHLRAQLPMQYNPDVRPLAQFVSINRSYVRPDNPYGYNDNRGGVFRRFDTLAGCRDYVARLVPPMRQANFQGMILWQPQGINPRGVQYRPDFDVFPPETLANLPSLVNGFKNAGLTIGLLARPGAVITVASESTDGLRRASNSKGELVALGKRLTWAKNKGFGPFYLDSFVRDGPDQSILKFIRNQLGRDVQTFTEFSTVLSLPLSGAYMEFRYKNGAYVFPKAYADLKWIYPEAVWCANFIGALPPGGYPALYAYMFQNQLTPLVQDHQLLEPQRMARLQTLVAQYIDGKHHWKVLLPAAPRRVRRTTSP
jgi:hypothetical protein